MRASGFRLPASGLALLVAIGEPPLAERLKAKIERLWRKPDPEIERANSNVRRGDPKSALDIYEKSAERLPEPRDQAALSFDRATAYIAEGKQSAGFAAEEARKALESVNGDLHARAAYNLGFSLADAGKRDEAIEAYGKSLRLDPADADARYNLELLLREKEQQKQEGGQGQQREDQKPGQQQDQQQKPNAGDQPQQQKDKSEQKKDPDPQKQQKQAGEGQDQKQQEQQKPDQGKDEEKKGTAPEKKQEQAQSKPVDRTEAQRLLDALKASEKNLQVWRFGQRRAQPQRQKDVAKDW